MKFLMAFLLTTLLSFVAGLYLPWWSLVLTSFLVAILIVQRAGMAFLSAFLGLFMLWGGIALWIDIRNTGILSGRISALLGIYDESWLLILITAFIGGLVAGFAAMSGSYIRSSKIRRA